MAKNKKRKRQTLRHKLGQFIEYNLAGLAFFWSAYAVLQGLSYIGWPLWASSSVSYVVGLTINFLLERYWVFDDAKDSSAIAVATERYVLLSVVNLGLNYAILKGLEVAGVPIEIAPFLAAGIFTPWNWLWYKYYVFAKNKPAPKPRTKAKPKRPQAKTKKRRSKKKR